jgi:type II secretory pathway component PulC
MDLATLLSGGFVLWAVGLFALGVSPQSPQSLPDSTLPVELLGVMLDAAEPSNSACLLRCTDSNDTQGTSLFGPGQDACDLVEVREVLQDTVVIRNLATHRLELLTFRRTNASPSEPASTTARPIPAPLVLRKAPNVVTVTLRKDLVDHYLSNPSDLLSSALATPHYRDDGNGRRTIDGFEIGSIKEASVVEQLGLQNGDVVLEFNGDKLDSLASVTRLFGEARVMAQAKMTVLRNGQTMTFVFDVK